MERNFFLRYVSRYKERLKDLKQKVHNMPITMFYKYLWKNEKNILLKSLAVNYILPLVLELLPWWLSRTKLEIALRKIKINITCDMQSNRGLNLDFLYKFVIFSLIRVFIDTLIKFWTDRVMLEHKFAIRKLILQKILHAEIEAFDDLKEKTAQRFTDVGQSLAIFNSTVPSIVSSFYSIYVGCGQLWANRERLDAFAFLYPCIFYLGRRLLDWIRVSLSHDFDERVRKKKKKERDLKTTEFISNLIDGLPDIQINNLQGTQLTRLDTLIDEELSNIRGVKRFADRLLKGLISQNVFQFAAESYLIDTIIRRKQIEYNQFLTIQFDLDHTLDAVIHIVELWKVITKELENQQKVRDLVNIPNWLNETHHLQIGEFNDLRIRGIKFAYKHSPFHALKFNNNQEMVFERGKTYGIVGQNMAGKSTLAHIICKLYEPEAGLITLNGIPYDHIGRKFLRDMISYTSQNPFIFPGTIRDNIKIGNPDATEEEVAEAALAAGVVAFSQSPSVSPSNEPVVTRDNLEQTIRQRFKEQEETRRNPSDEETEPDFTDNSPPSLARRFQQQHPSSSSIECDSPFFQHKKSGNASLSSICDPQLLQAVLDTHVTTRGKNMSGGLAQSVALARVYVRPKAKIVILDEAVGQMDSFKRRCIVFPELFKFIEKHDMTLVLVSHDMQTVKMLDHIFVMDTGRVVHQGSHEDLVKQNAFGYLQLTEQAYSKSGASSLSSSSRRN